jgi:hypothetical protein
MDLSDFLVTVSSFIKIADGLHGRFSQLEGCHWNRPNQERRDVPVSKSDGRRQVDIRGQVETAVFHGREKSLQILRARSRHEHLRAGTIHSGANRAECRGGSVCLCRRTRYAVGHLPRIVLDGFGRSWYRCHRAADL